MFKYSTATLPIAGNMVEVDEKITVNKLDYWTKRQIVNEDYLKKFTYPIQLILDLNDPQLLPPNYSEVKGGTLKLIEGGFGAPGSSFSVELSKRRASMPFWHRNWDNDELILCISGEAIWETEIGAIKLIPGRMIIIPRGVAHKVSVREDTNYIAVEIKSPNLKIIYRSSQP